jgi:hypothetical protein
MLIALELVACGVSTSEFVSVCYNDAQEEVPCCGPAGEKYACPPDAGDDADVDAGDDAEADAGEDDGGPEAGSDGSAFFCPGQCVPQGGGGFSESPLFVWMGQEWETPPAPLAKNTAWTGWVDVTFAEPNCPTCTCAAPVGGCELPGSWTANSSVCQALPSANQTMFDAPTPWDGSCSATNSIPAGMVCGNGPCVQSLIVAPPEVVEECMALPETDPDGEPLPSPSRTKVLAYSTTSFGPCEGGIDQCIVPTPPGYRLCVARYEDDGYSCPPDWPERHEGWGKVEEQRICTPCVCGAVEGSSCIVRANAYSDSLCAQEVAMLILSTAEPAKCTDLLSGSALGSKTAEVLSHEPGTCQPSGGELLGDTFKKDPIALCCLPEPQ